MEGKGFIMKNIKNMLVLGIMALTSMTYVYCMDTELATEDEGSPEQLIGFIRDHNNAAAINLIRQGVVDLNGVDQNGQTPLVVAIQTAQDLDLVVALFQHGARFGYDEFFLAMRRALQANRLRELNTCGVPFRVLSFIFSRLSEDERRSFFDRMHEVGFTVPSFWLWRLGQAIGQDNQ